MITSVSNPSVRRIIQLQTKAKIRRKERRFVAEGARLCREVPSSLIERIYFCPALLTEEERVSAEAWLDQMAALSIPQEEVSPVVMKACADTVTPQGVLAVCALPPEPADFPAVMKEALLPERAASAALTLSERENAVDLGQDTLFVPGAAQKTAGSVREAPLLLLLEDIRDPGNLGTMFRTAEGAGASGILMSTGCVDCTSPKVLRSTMGSLFRVPYVVADDWQSTLASLRKNRIHLYAATLSGSVSYETCDYTVPCAFLIGNEARGLLPETAAAADSRIRIPMAGSLESLNAAISAGILMYEARRQRTLH